MMRAVGGVGVRLVGRAACGELVVELGEGCAGSHPVLLIECPGVGSDEYCT